MMLAFEWNFDATVCAFAGLSCVSPSTNWKFVLFALLNRATANFEKLSCSFPIDAAGPVAGPIQPSESEVHGVAVEREPAALTRPASAAATAATATSRTRPAFFI